MLCCYARILAHYPFVVIAVVSVVVVACLVVSITSGENLNFDDPRAGFETRGTEISKRLVAYYNLIRNKGNKLSMTPFSHQQDGIVHRAHLSLGRKKNRTTKKKQFTAADEDDDDDNEQPYYPGTDEGSEDYAKSFFCDVLDQKYARITFQTNDGSSLFSLNHIQSMCILEERVVRSNSMFNEICIASERKCPSWSLGNYIALLQNRTSCWEITDQDVQSVLQLLRHCSEFFLNYSLGPNCDSRNALSHFDYQTKKSHCKTVPAKCIRYNAVYHILFYLTDMYFSNFTNLSQPFLKYAMTFLPFAQGSATVELFQHMEKQPLHDGKVELAAASFGIKDILFKKYLLSDTVWLAITGCTIFLAIWLYSTSFFIAIMTFLGIFWSLEIAYFLYVLVFEIKFFPYMNMVSIMIMLGIGADDVFIYSKVWNLAKSEKNNGTLEKIVSDTLRHATLSMLVTSMTTAAAFYANFISDITAIQCFSIYAGTAVLCNFLLMITWIPASIVIYEKSCNCLSCYSQKFYAFKNICYYLCRLPHKIHELISDWSRIFFEKLLPCLVIKFRYFWIFSYGGLGISAMVVVLYYPGIKLPSMEKFQYFSSLHLLEMYDLDLFSYFWFEKPEIERIPLMPITIIWGVVASDNGDHLNPDSKGVLEFDHTFRLESPKAQSWLLNFCKRLRTQPFYQSTPGYEVTNCFLENFRIFMSSLCINSGLAKQQECCNQTKFPYSPDLLTQCMDVYIPMLMKTPYLRSFYHHESPGPRFMDGQIRAFIVEFSSIVPYSNSYDKLKSFYTQINHWVTTEILQAPDEMRRGWFVSHLDFFDIQNSLVHGLPLAIGVSITVSALVIFFTTLNVVISLYAVITISFVIFTTIGALILLGWELNILESVVITIAIGMSIDFTLHYGVAYRMSPDLDKEARVVCSIARMGTAIAMASLTTFLAGALMMPSTVLIYQQLGTFLMLNISTSWMFSTFFFQSLLGVIGPRGGFGQFFWPNSDCCSSSPRNHVDKTVYSLSESTLSSSTTSNPAHACSEIHELECLTNRQTLHSHTMPYYHHHHHYHPQQHPHQSIQHRVMSKGQYTRARSQSTSPELMPKRESIVTFKSPNSSPRSKNKETLKSKNKFLRADLPQKIEKDNSSDVWIKRTDNE